MEKKIVTDIKVIDKNMADVLISEDDKIFMVFTGLKLIKHIIVF